MTRAKLCLTCGYVLPGEEASADFCDYCGARLDGQTSDFPQALFEQPTVRAIRSARISSEEEERARQGYRLTTHFRITGGVMPRRVELKSGGGQALLAMTYLPRAELWRINNGWRRTSEQAGFTIDLATGAWRPRLDDAPEDESGIGETHRLLPGVRPYVKDGRNILLLRPLAGEAGEGFFKTLAYAFKRAIQLSYQLEEQEIAGELIGRAEHQQILFWEAAEGGIGVWERLIEDRSACAQIARQALQICHVDPSTGEDLEGWAERCCAACYDCLLSYSN